jgi:predicted O-linked N-acetylglucosamine transferase (SPINDLY family)
MDSLTALPSAVAAHVPAHALSTPARASEQQSVPAEYAAPFDAARQGALSLGEVMGLAAAWQAAGRAELAALLYRVWIDHNESPLRHVACFNRGTLLSAAEQDEEAEQAYLQMLALAPGFVPALLNLAHLQERKKQHEAALATWREVFEAQPPVQLEHRLHAINNSARLLETQHRYPEAEALMRRSLELKAAQYDVIQHYIHIRQKQCAWPHDLAVGDVSPNQFLQGTSLLAMMGLSDDPALQLLIAQRFVHERVVPPAAHIALPLHAQAPPREDKADTRIRVGYLSGDLHMHAVGLLTAELFELHDRSRFEVWAFCWTPESNQPLRQRILKAVDHHVRLAGVDDHTAARLIAQADIDVLVDLQGLTNGARPGILGYRAAPVQLSYLGLPGTAALPGVDWILADRFVMPPELLPYCTERPIYLPHSYQVSDRQREVGPKPTRSALGLPEEAFVFCSFNNNHKFTAAVFAAWMRIVAAVPGSVLWLLADNPTARQNMQAAAAAAGVASERLVFAPRAAPPDYLARFQLADLVLDTFPYNAGTTASDALWMGTPLLTLAGRTYISRMAGSLLQAVGLPDLITESLPAYEALAITLGRNPARVASYKRYLAEHARQSPLFDVPQTVRDIEAQFERLVLATGGRPGP